MQPVLARIVVRKLVHFYKAAPRCARGVAKKLGLGMEKYADWAKLSLADLIKKTSA